MRALRLTILVPLWLAMSVGARESAALGEAPETTEAEAPGPDARERARTHHLAGKAAFDALDYERALREFRQAYALAPIPELLYNIGSCHEHLGHRREAISSYELYLAARLDAEDRAALLEHVAELRRSLGSPAVVQPRPWFRDPLGGALMGSGAAGLGVGGALVGIALHRSDEELANYRQFVDARSAPGLWTAGVVVMAVGGALVAAGILRYSVKAASRPGRARASAPTGAVEIALF